MRKNFSHSKGLSIVETLVSIAILTVIVAVVVSLAVVLARGQGQIRVARRLGSSAVISMERMSRALRGASSFDVSQSVFDAHPGKLTVIANDGTTSTTTTFSLSGGVLTVEVNGVSEGPLTAAEVSVDSLIFRHLVTPVSEGVRIEMQLASAYGGATGKVMLYTTVFARGGYQ